MSRLAPHPFPTLAILAALLLAPVAAADPPGTCVGGYNPNALSNVCYQSGPGSTFHPGSVGVGPSAPVCIIGNLCQDVPMPTYTPGGGPGVPVPGVLTPTYVSVAGVAVYPHTPCGDDGSGIKVGNVCVQSCGDLAIQVGTLCLSGDIGQVVGPCYEDGTGLAINGRCQVQGCTDAYGNFGIQVGNRCFSLGAQ